MSSLFECLSFKIIAGPKHYQVIVRTIIIVIIVTQCWLLMRKTRKREPH